MFFAKHSAAAVKSALQPDQRFVIVTLMAFEQADLVCGEQGGWMQRPKMCKARAVYSHQQGQGFIVATQHLQVAGGLFGRPQRERRISVVVSQLFFPHSIRQGQRFVEITAQVGQARLE